MTIKHRVKLAVAKLSWKRRDIRTDERAKKFKKENREERKSDDKLTNFIDDLIYDLEKDKATYGTTNEEVAARCVTSGKIEVLREVITFMYGKE